MSGFLDTVTSALRRPWGPLSALAFVVALLFMAVDQGFKLWMIHAVRIAEVQPIAIGPYLELVMAWNYGVSYGMFAQETDLGRWALVAVKLAAVIGLWLWSAQSTSRLVVVSLALIIGGALGNMIDRVMWGAVADFFHVQVPQIGFSWYIFNLADVWIVAGVAGLLFDSFRSGHDDAAKPAS